MRARPKRIEVRVMMLTTRSLMGAGMRPTRVDASIVPKAERMM